ncbi:MAG: hypothetical protein A2W93_01510 [Bacteroidetes bacterium GWF2_43_63]|nr:MAG: hypothetical protein A2W94_10560 [Bacteroidetes bacterium GWE2_42_42]OFY55747.1 MAG: hypothetical protein A2W93_01510 [Bacteroidetes bacterium GWF2_43_63]HBG71340.1 hypothetical protein [Bacteroidales bacterium]HCB60440.1 hypothetical protein [Bacteroidales bacterium]HCY22603.1 hypothetical protein [Bacteroidales bacterium]
MKTTNVSLFLIVSVLLLFSSCGGKQRAGSSDADDSLSAKNECVKETSLTLFVDKKGLKENKGFITGDSVFAINKQKFIFTNDSVAEIYLDGIVKLASGAEDKVSIAISLYTKNGIKINPGIYKNMDFDNDYFAKVSLQTEAGTIWFNWASGMPDPGAITINQIDRNTVCGSVHLNVDKPDNNSIGIVKLNGNFYIEK